MRWAFWICLAAIVIATLGPIELRPETGLPPSGERWLGFFMLGLPATVAYPRHRVTILLALVIVAGGLEALQNAVPGRHGRWIDFDVKTFGLFCGAALGLLLERVALARSPA